MNNIIKVFFNTRGNNSSDHGSQTNNNNKKNNEGLSVMMSEGEVDSRQIWAIQQIVSCGKSGSFFSLTNNSWKALLRFLFVVSFYHPIEQQRQQKSVKGKKGRNNKGSNDPTSLEKFNGDDMLAMLENSGVDMIPNINFPSVSPAVAKAAGPQFFSLLSALSKRRNNNNNNNNKSKTKSKTAKGKNSHEGNYLERSLEWLLHIVAYQRFLDNSSEMKRRKKFSSELEEAINDAGKLLDKLLKQRRGNARHIHAFELLISQVVLISNIDPNVHEALMELIAIINDMGDNKIKTTNKKKEEGKKTKNKKKNNDDDSGNESGEDDDEE